MHPLLFPTDLMLYALAALGSFRAFWVLYCAEQGRRHDLIRHTPIQRNDFEIAVLIVLQNDDDAKALMDLLTCGKAQTYDPTKVLWMVLSALPDSAEVSKSEGIQNFKWLEAPPSTYASKEAILQWGLHRFFSTHRSDLIIYLNPHDLIKPDFLSHTASMAYQYDVYQGYIAHRDFGEGLLSRSLGILTRLHSRIQSVGRSHGGLGLLFRSSGFAFKPSILERFPIQYDEHLGFAPWSITLNQAGLLVRWVPQMIVYQRDYPDLFEHVLGQVHAIKQASMGLVLRFMRLAPPRELEQRMALFPHNPMFKLFILVGMGIQVAQNEAPSLWGASTTWFVLAGLQAFIWLTTLAVARIRWQDWLGTTVIVTTAMFLELFALPVSLILGALETLKNNMPLPQKAFSFAKQAPLGVSTPLFSSNTKALSTPSTHHTLETSLPLLLRFASQEILGTVLVDLQRSHQGLSYALTLHYKRQQVTTTYHPSLEDAFSELSTRLAHYQIQPKTCGNCAYWHVPQLEKNVGPQQGLCLRETEPSGSIDQAMATLNVLATPCSFHTDRAQYAFQKQAWDARIPQPLT